jgi:hypothetical protein
MGRAWDRESAVFRVAGVINVIGGGWFITACCILTAWFSEIVFLQFGKVLPFLL